MKRIVQTLAAGLLAWTVAAQAPASLQQRVAAIMSRPEFVHARFGMEFWALNDNTPVFRMNEQQFFVPGSTTKLLTEGTALALLGADYRFHTRVFRSSEVDSGGTLHGDLILVASGDPNLSNRIQPDGTLAFQNVDHSYDGQPASKPVAGDPLAVIRELARQVAKAGIKQLTGRVLVDAGLFPEGARELGTNVVISPFVVNDNVIDLTITPGIEGAAPQLSVSPPTAYLRINNQLKTGAATVKPVLHWLRDAREPDGSRSVTLTGSVPAGPAIFRAYRVPEPSRFAQLAFVESLKEAGVSIAPMLEAAAPAAQYKPEFQVAEHVSPPLSEEVKVTLKVSQNLHASMTPYLVGALLGKNRENVLQAGFDLEREFLKKADLDLSGAAQSDGAGGAAFYTPDFMVHYLVWLAHRESIFPALFKALPVLGKDGTLWDIQPDSPAAGHVHAKTGTFSAGDLLNHSLMVTGKGIAGYIDRQDGRRLAFAAYVNMVDGDPETIAHRVGDALGEIAAAAWDAPLN
jgi:D-alanyl-D-alanine carboxypeptidase/D-alanyl-D-alanine-endopeptidase (penicillin-binding protein 4)